jgi:hypothetical protein
MSAELYARKRDLLKKMRDEALEYAIPDDIDELSEGDLLAIVDKYEEMVAKRGVLYDEIVEIDKSLTEYGGQSINNEIKDLKNEIINVNMKLSESVEKVLDLLKRELKNMKRAKAVNKAYQSTYEQDEGHEYV